MNTIRTYKAILLLFLFGLSLLPYSAFHTHEDDPAIHAMHAPEHHCAYDEFACQTGISQTCEHNQHISKSIAKCFSCQFHFIKSFYKSQNNFENTFLKLRIAYAPQLLKAYRQCLLTAANRGPPAIA